MIATILPSSPTFHAVAYNEMKIAQGSATLLEIKNFGPINTFGYSDPQQLIKFLMEYSACNNRIKQPQFHLAISCKGHEHTESELVEFAHKYLEEMGYNNPGQPLLIYGHRDTDNTHVHIITSRVDPKGKKINDSHEKRRSQKAIEKIMKTDLKASAKRDIDVAMQFDFRNINQFKAVMEAMNYECYESEGTLCIKKGGMVQTKIDIEAIKKIADKNKLYHRNDIAENARWRAIFKKYRETNCSRSGLERDLKKIFGISLVFFGKKDSPYGYVAVDFNKKKIYEGGKILNAKELLDFKTPEEHINDIETFIVNTFEQYPYTSTKGLNQKLRKMGAYVKKDTVVFGNIKKPLADSHRALLERNNKIEWRNGFKPQSIEERDLLCRLTGYGYPDLISYKQIEDGKYFCKDYEELYKILNITDTEDRIKAFKTAGFSIVVEGNSTYAYRPETQTLTDLTKSGFEDTLYKPLITPYHNTNAKPNMQEDKQKFQTPVARQDGSRYSNREWEVGKHGKDRDDMDQNDKMSY